MCSPPAGRETRIQASGQDRVRCDPAGSKNWTASRIDNAARLGLLAMELHPLAQGFAGVADDYERGRPGYPPEAIAALGLPGGARVADVGAGTGKLTRALRAAGLDVVAV
jgi:2-polyprenyl-3-methyl-5-hydroxy-6-metoxy-1,4-benzoquinol methylase